MRPDGMPRKRADVEFHALLARQAGQPLMRETRAQRGDHRPQSDDRQQEDGEPEPDRGGPSRRDQDDAGAPEQDEVTDESPGT